MSSSAFTHFSGVSMTLSRLTNSRALTFLILILFGLDRPGTAMAEDEADSTCGAVGLAFYGFDVDVDPSSTS
jgi:hypothetical protein